MNIYFVAMGILSSNSMSGSDKALIEIAKIWKQDKINIITIDKGKNLFEKYLRVNYFIQKSKFENPILAYAYRIKKFKPFKLPKNAVIYSSSNLYIDVYPSYLLKKLNPQAKWIVAFHMAAPNPFKGHTKSFSGGLKIPNIRNSINYLAEKKVFSLIKKADGILAINEFNKNLLVKKGFDEKKIEVVDNGVNLEEIASVKQKEKEYSACFVGRFHQQKGILDLVDIWKEVCKKDSSAKIVVIGSGELEGRLKTKIKEEFLEGNFILKGHLDGKKKIELVKSSKVFVFPSTYESWGIVAAEAMACGLPVVAYDLPVYHGVFDKGMIRVPIGKSELFAKEVIRLLEDNKTYSKFSEEAISLAKNYSWKKVADRERNFMEKIAKSKLN